MSVTRPLFGGMSDRDGWQDDAACSGVDIDVYFSLDEGNQRRAIELCRTCPVQQECLRYAIEHDELYGIWGGMLESERRALIRDRRRQGRGRRIDAA